MTPSFIQMICPSESTEEIASVSPGHELFLLSIVTAGNPCTDMLIPFDVTGTETAHPPPAVSTQLTTSPFCRLPASKLAQFAPAFIPSTCTSYAVASPASLLA